MVKVDLKELEGLMREVSVEIPAETVEGEMDKKFKEVRQSVTIKGFRKGKAPMDRIKAMYADEVKADVVEELIRTSYPEAVRGKELRVCAPPTVTAADFGDDGSFNYTAQVEVYPEVENVVYDGMTVAVPEAQVNDDDVDQFLEMIRRQNAAYEAVAREAKDDDVVLVDLKKVLDPDLVMQEDSFDNLQIDLSSQVTLPEFREHLPGLKAGATKELLVRYPENYSDQRFAGASITFNCTVREVQKRILPELTDEFARLTGQAETALELRMKAREQLEANIKEQQERDRRGGVISQLCTKNEIPVPEALIEEYLSGAIEDFKKRYKDVDEAEVRKNYRDVAARTIRWNLLYRRLAEQQDIKVSPEDTEERLKRFAEKYGMTLEQAKAALSQPNTIAEIRDSILEEKVLDFLVDRAEVVTTKERDKDA